MDKVVNNLIKAKDCPIWSGKQTVLAIEAQESPGVGAAIALKLRMKLEM